MNPSANETTETKGCKVSLDYLIPISILFVLTFVLSVAENILVSVAIVVDRRLRRPSNGYLLSLALTDICISFGLIPLEMTYIWSYPEWPLGPRETNVFNSVWFFSIAGSFVTVLVITVDRYRAVLSLVRYREVVSWGRTLVITTLVWLYVVVVVILMRVSSVKTVSEKTYDWNVNYKSYYAFLAVHIALPLLIICALYYKIYNKAVENRQQLLLQGRMHPGTQTAASDRLIQTRLEVRMAKTVGLVIMFMVIIWVPVLVVELVYATRNQSCIIEKLDVVSDWLICSSGMINPVIYYLRNKDFRHAILKLIHCKRPRSASVLA